MYLSYLIFICNYKRFSMNTIDTDYYTTKRPARCAASCAGSSTADLLT